jgi:hypothetical protein
MAADAGKKQAGGMVRIAKDLADALAVIAQARDVTISDVLDDLCRDRIVAAFKKSWKQLEPALAHDIGGEGG